MSATNYTVAVRYSGQSGDQSPIVLERKYFRTFATAARFARKTVMDHLAVDPNREATITPNACYLYAPDQGFFAGRPFLCVTIVSAELR